MTGCAEYAALEQDQPASSKFQDSGFEAVSCTCVQQWTGRKECFFDHQAMTCLESDTMIVFKHCSMEKNVFCLIAPEACPICGGSMEENGFLEKPRPVFAPWRCSESFPCSLVIKPTCGTFAKYDGEQDLHIGISSRDGAVTHFEDDGVATNSTWAECVPVFTMSSSRSCLTPGHHDQRHSQDKDTRAQCLWDNVITVHSISWKIEHLGHRYHEVHHNCFDFVWGFIESLASLTDGVELFPSTFHSKEDLTRRLVLPSLQRVLKFIHLYDQVKQSSVIVRPV